MKQKKGQRTQVGGTEEGIKKKNGENRMREVREQCSEDHISRDVPRGEERRTSKSKMRREEAGSRMPQSKQAEINVFPDSPILESHPFFSLSLSLSLSENGATVTPSLYSS